MAGGGGNPYSKAPKLDKFSTEKPGDFKTKKPRCKRGVQRVRVNLSHKNKGIYTNKLLGKRKEKAVFKTGKKVPLQLERDHPGGVRRRGTVLKCLGVGNRAYWTRREQA